MLRIKFNKKVGSAVTGLGSVVKVFSSVGSSSLADLVAIKDSCTTSANSASTSATAAASSALLSEAAIVKATAANFELARAQNNEQFAASGSVHFGKHWLGQPNINEGLYPYTNDSAFPNILFLGRNTTSAGLSKTNSPVINVAGVLFYIQNINTVNTSAENKVKFPQAPDGKTTYNKSTGVITNHATVTAAFNAQAADQTNVEVVTDRVDMWGFEAWLEEVSTANPYVYPNGLIQSQATAMDGITTSASARPVTYYAVFDGDTGSKGKGLNYFALSDANKKKVLANSKNNLYYLDDGRLVQWRLRQRTIAGAGNGNWEFLDTPPATLSKTLSFNEGVNGGPQTRVKPQGVRDSISASLNSYAGGVISDYMTSATGSIVSAPSVNTGLWGVRSSLSFGINNECYFLVCGTVNRLNQGAYHPSFNPSGAKFWINTTNGGGAYWYVSSAGNNNVSTALCFNQVEAGTTGVVGARNQSGYIGDSSARPDGRFYDAIYADGQGGVCRDMRYSANGVDEVDFAEADQKVKNGTYRGFENLKFSYPTTIDNVLTSYLGFGGTKPYFLQDIPNIGSVTVNWKVHIIRGSSLLATLPVYLTGNAGGSIGWYIRTGVNGSSVNHFALTTDLLVLERLCVNSVGGSFLQTDVIGNPVNILATPQLANGWHGSWIPVIPDGTPKDFIFTRKNIGSVVDRTYTTNNGGSWLKDVMPNFVSAINGAAAWFVPAANIYLIQYTAFAKQTENAANAVVYGGNLGVGQVFATSDAFLPAQNRGTLLKESLTGGTKGIAAAYTNGPMQVLSVKQLTMNSDKLLSGRAAYDVKHDEIVIDGNTIVNGVKALNYNVNINQQAFIQYAYTELTHNGTNWGDDGKVTIIDNQATKTDLNGNTVLVGTAKLKEPIGWIRNKV